VAPLPARFSSAGSSPRAPIVPAVAVGGERDAGVSLLEAPGHAAAEAADRPDVFRPVAGMALAMLGVTVARDVTVQLPVATANVRSAVVALLEEHRVCHNGQGALISNMYDGSPRFALSQRRLTAGWKIRRQRWASRFRSSTISSSPSCARPYRSCRRDVHLRPCRRGRRRRADSRVLLRLVRGRLDRQPANHLRDCRGVVATRRTRRRTLLVDRARPAAVGVQDDCCSWFRLTSAAHFFSQAIPSWSRSRL